MKIAYPLIFVFAFCIKINAEIPHDYKRYSVSEYAHKIADQFSALAQNA